MAMTEETFKGVSSRSIFYRAWRPEIVPRGVVVISHGFNAHGGQYLWVAEQLVAKGFAVYAPDHHGRGRSEGERFFVASFGDYVADMHTMVGIAKLRDPGLAVFMLGHSAGGVIASVYALEHPGELAGLICESFAFEVPAPAIVLSLVKAISKFAPHLGVLKLPNKAFSRNPAAVAALNADPLIKDEKQPALTVAEMVRGNERLRREFPLMKLPVLIIHGTADSVTLASGSKFFHQTAGSADKTLKLYDGHFHDLLADTGKETVMADVVGWVEQRLPA